MNVPKFGLTYEFWLTLNKGTMLTLNKGTRLIYNKGTRLTLNKAHTK